MFKTDILFTGFYGHQNTGDDAFVEVASWGAERFWNKRNNRFLSKSHNLPHTLQPSKGYPLTLSKTYRLQRELLLRNTSYLISAGGSTFHRKMETSNLKIKALQLKESGKAIKIGGIGVSVGPFKSLSAEKSVERYLKNIDFLAVRDQTSYDYVSSLNLPYKPINSFDLAALLPEIYNFDETQKTSGKKKIIGVSVCPYESLQNDMESKLEETRNIMVVDLIKQLDIEEDIHFKFYVINGNERIGDHTLTKDTIAKADPQSFEIVQYSKNTQQVWESISECDFIISTRLHAAIFACFSNTPFMLNEYHRKCSDFLFNVGYEESYRLFNSEYEIKEKARQIIEIVNDSSKFIYPKFTANMKSLAKLNFTSISL